MPSPIRSSVFAVACVLAGCYGDHGDHSSSTTRGDAALADASGADASTKTGVTDAEAPGKPVRDAAVMDVVAADATVADAARGDAAVADASAPRTAPPAADGGEPGGIDASDSDDGGLDDPSIPVSPAVKRLRRILGSYDVAFYGTVGSKQPRPIVPPAEWSIGGDVQFSHTGRLIVTPGEPLPIQLPEGAQLTIDVPQRDLPSGVRLLENALGLELATAHAGPPGTFGLSTDVGFHQRDGVFDGCGSAESFECLPVFGPQDPSVATSAYPAWMVAYVSGNATSVHVIAELLYRGGNPDSYGARAFMVPTKNPDGSDSWYQLPFLLHATIELFFNADGGVSGTIRGRAGGDDPRVSGEALFEATVAGVKRLPPAPP